MIFYQVYNYHNSKYWMVFLFGCLSVVAGLLTALMSTILMLNMSLLETIHIYPCQWSSNTIKKVWLIYMKNTDNECFRWCHIRYLNPQDKDLHRIKKTDRNMVQELNYQSVEFSVTTKHYGKIEEKNNININVFGYEDKQFYLIYISKQNNEKVLNLLLISDGQKKHYVLIKDFNRMMCNKTKHKERKHFCMHCL